MKVTVAQAAAGLDSYIQSEFVGKIQDWRKWAVAAGSGLVKDKAVNIVNSLKNNPVVKTMGIIDEDDKIDIEILYKHFYKAAEATGPVTQNILLLGPTTFTASDIEKLYTAIMTAAQAAN